MYFAFLFTVVLFLFRNAFSINFFADDYFFLKISRVESFGDFFGFFSPIREHFYRPVGSEVYYFLIHTLGDNLILGHALSFSVFFIGIYFLSRIIEDLSGNKIFARVAVFLYAINFVHVFQLYYFGTFQEVAVFAFLAIALFNFLKGKNFNASLFFILALLSKETAILFSLFVPFLVIFIKKGRDGKYRRGAIAFVVISIIFAVLYQYSLKYVTQIDNYKIQLNPRLFVNNTMWYFLWSLGFPNFMPDYMTSIFRPPIKEFWKLIVNFPETKPYFMSLFSYLFMFVSGLLLFIAGNKKEIKKLISLMFFSAVGFGVFVAQIAFFQHKWMVRLTLPLIFVSLFQAYVIFLFYKKGGLFKFISYLLVILYFILNVIGIKIHESSSTFFLESRVSDHLKLVITKNRSEILSAGSVYFKDVKLKDFNPWGQSKHLKTTLSDQNFTDLYFPRQNIRAIYGFENPETPDGSFVIPSLELLKP